MQKTVVSSAFYATKSKMKNKWRKIDIKNRLSTKNISLEIQESQISFIFEIPCFLKLEFCLLHFSEG